MKKIIQDEGEFKKDAKILSLKELAMKYNMKKCTVSKWKKKLNVLKVPKNIPLPDKNVFEKEVKKYTNKQLAEKYSVSLKLISKWRIKLGFANIWTKKVVDWKEFDKDACVLNNKELLRKYNVSLSTVKLWKQERGLTTGKRENKFIRFFVNEKTGCWICTSHELNQFGYPQCKGDKLVVKRVWKEKNGKWPEGKVCIHKCDNTMCINSDHIYPGTMKQNQSGMADRHRSPWGWRNGVRKLTPEQAKAAYSLKDQLSLRKVAKMFGVSSATIFYLWKGKIWWRDVAGMGNFPVKLTSIKSGMTGMIERKDDE